MEHATWLLYPKPFEIFKRKNLQYERIEYSVEHGQSLYYLNNNNLHQNFLLWCVNADSFVAPLPTQLPEGYSFQKVLYPIATKFTMHYRKDWSFIMDQNYNVYLRIHWEAVAMNWVRKPSPAYCLDATRGSGIRS